MEIQHIRQEWLSVVARLQQMASSQNGAAIITMTVVVGPDGNPSFWSEPSMKKLEPRSRGDLIAALISTP